MNSTQNKRRFTFLYISIFIIIAGCAFSFLDNPTNAQGNISNVQPIFKSSSTINGPIRVNPDNPRYFTDDSGRAILLTGSHTWANFQDAGDSDPPPVFNYTAYLDFLEANNHNFFRLWTWEQAKWAPWTTGNIWFAPSPYQRPGPGLALDGKPKFDVTSYNQAYFDRLRDRVIQAGNRGIYASIMLFDGWSIDDKSGTNPGNAWPGHPFNEQNNINGIDGDLNNNGKGEETHTLQSSTITDLQEAYVRKVIDTVNDLDNVLYEISNESPSNSQDWQYHMINYIKAYETTKPKQHPVGMTVEYPGGNNSELFASPADWISPNSDGGYQDNPPAADGSKIIISDTDHLWGIGGDRIWAWKSFIRGIHPIFMDCYSVIYCEGQDPYDPAFVSLRENLGYIRDYADRMNLVDMTPHGNLASSGYALANPVADGAEFLVYVPNGGSVTVNLSAASGELNVEWFRPENGSTIDGGVVLGGSTQSFTAPFGGDAVLYIYDSGITTATPGPTPNRTKTPQPSFTPTVKPDSTPTPTLTTTPAATSIYSPTPDYQPPWIYNIQAIPFDVTAWVTWNTNEPATSVVFYGLNPSNLDANIVSSEFVTDHYLELNNLTPNTKYYYVVSSKDLPGNETTSETKSFITLGTEKITRVFFPDLLKFKAIQSTSP